MAISLDRFSQPMSWELAGYQSEDHMNVVEMEEEPQRCEGCGRILYFGEEEIVETEFMDEFIHDDEECKGLYKEKELRGNATQSIR